MANVKKLDGPQSEELQRRKREVVYFFKKGLIEIARKRRQTF